MSKFDLAKTQVVAELFETPKDNRDEEWRRRFYAAVPDATLMSFDPQVNQGPDRFPYFHMAIPDPGPVTPFCVSHILDVVLDNGFGIAIFGDSSRSDAPQWVFTYGDLLSYSLYGNFDGDPAFQPSSPDVRQTATPVLAAAPSEAYLPARARKAIGNYAREIFKLPDPKIALVDSSQPGTRHLMINLTLEQYDGDEKKLGAALHYLTWFLPRTYRIAAMPSGWTDSLFVPLD